MHEVLNTLFVTALVFLTGFNSYGQKKRVKKRVM